MWQLSQQLELKKASFVVGIPLINPDSFVISSCDKIVILHLYRLYQLIITHNIEGCCPVYDL